jgi:hypothetical protein
MAVLRMIAVWLRYHPTTGLWLLGWLVIAVSQGWLL